MRPSSWHRTGSTLEVRIDEPAVRLDALLRPTNATILQISVTEREGGPTWTFEEAIAPATGRVIQHVAHCARPITNGSCDPKDLALVLFAPLGYPGALGAAPHWSEPAAEPWNPLLESGDLRLTTSPAEEGCLVSELASESASTRYRGIGWLGGGRPALACPGETFPRWYTTAHGERMVRTSSDRGSGQVIPLRIAQAGEEPERSTLTTRPVRLPLAVADPTEETAFPVSEAHEAALAASSSYRQRVQGGEAIVAATHVHESGGGALLDHRISGSVERALWVADPDGRALRVLVEKRLDLDLHASYELLEETDEQWEGDIPTPSSLPRATSAFAGLLELGDHLTATGHPRPTDYGHGHWANLPDHAWNPQTRTTRDDGQTVVIWFKPRAPHPVVPGVETPYAFFADGPSGAVLWFETDASRLPIDERYVWP